MSRLHCFVVLGLILSIGGIFVQISKVSHQFKYNHNGNEQKRNTKKKHSSSPAMTVILSKMDNGRSSDRKDDFGDALASSSSRIEVPKTRTNSRDFQTHSLQTRTAQIADKSDVNNKSTFHTLDRVVTSSESWNANSTMLTNTTTERNEYEVVGRYKPRNPLIQSPARRPLVWSNLSIHHVVESLEKQDMLEENVVKSDEKRMSESSPSSIASLITSVTPDIKNEAKG